MWHQTVAMGDAVRMPRTSLALGLIAATTPWVTAGCSSEPSPPRPPNVADSTASTSSTTPTRCSVLTTKKLRELTDTTKWTPTTAASDVNGATTCARQTGDDGAAVTVIAAQDWYTALAARGNDEPDMDSDKTSTTVNACHDGSAIHVSVPDDTDDQALGALVDAVKIG